MRSFQGNERSLDAQATDTLAEALRSSFAHGRLRRGRGQQLLVRGFLGKVSRHERLGLCQYVSGPAYRLCGVATHVGVIEGATQQGALRRVLETPVYIPFYRQRRRGTGTTRTRAPRRKPGGEDGDGDAGLSPTRLSTRTS
eukprot:m51a1_g7789 hypothetical protein (141) ;mRNA; r:3275-5235